MDLHILGWITAVLLILLGLAGNILPVLPAAPLLIAGFIVGAWQDDFQRVGWIWLVILAALGVGIMVIDFIAGAWGATKLGASKLAMLGATLGSLIGMFFGLPGLILGPFFGAIIGELIAGKDVIQAGGVGFATWLGMVAGMIVKTGLSLAMVAMFAFAYFI